jgi:hypothetical protein
MWVDNVLADGKCPHHPVQTKRKRRTTMAETFARMAMGWLPDYPDFRDYTAEHDRVDVKLQSLGQKDSVKAMLRKVRAAQPARALPPTVDLRAWCSPIENQLNLGSCTANAGVGLVE